MATPITFTSLLQAALKACTFALINGGLLAFAFEIYGLLCRRLALPNPELVEQRRKLAKDECNRYDPFAHMEVADWWQFIRILLIMLHLVLVVVAALENGHDWRFSLAFVVEISGFLFGLVTIKSTWQWFRRLLNEGIYAAAEDLGWYLRVLHAAIVAIGCGLLATKAAVMAIPPAFFVAISIVISAARHEVGPANADAAPHNPATHQGSPAVTDDRAGGAIIPAFLQNVEWPPVVLLRDCSYSSPATLSVGLYKYDGCAHDINHIRHSPTSPRFTMASPVTFTTILYGACKALIDAGLAAGGFKVYGRLSKFLLPPSAKTEQNREALALNKRLYYGDPFEESYRTTDGWKVLRMVPMAFHIIHCLVEGFQWMHSLDALMSVSSFMIGLFLFQRLWQWNTLPAGQRNEDIKAAARASGRYIRSGRAAIVAVPAAARAAMSTVLSAAKHEFEGSHTAPTVEAIRPVMKAPENTAEDTKDQSNEAAITSTEEVDRDALRKKFMETLSVAADLGRFRADGTWKWL
ncbi:hypothetical protein LTR17_024177 [Elasticomyces elasticus]|nr:hypothetical protein LTR17_024177 [Elasticomyces elasticus]